MGIKINVNKGIIFRAKPVYLDKGNPNKGTSASPLFYIDDIESSKGYWAYLKKLNPRELEDEEKVLNTEYSLIIRDIIPSTNGKKPIICLEQAVFEGDTIHVMAENYKTNSDNKYIGHFLSYKVFINETNNLNPDLIVKVGDYVYGKVSNVSNDRVGIPRFLELVPTSLVKEERFRKFENIIL